MKFIKNILIAMVMVVGLSVAAFAQKDDQKKPPPKDPPTVNPGTKPPRENPPKENPPKKPRFSFAVIVKENGEIA